MWLVHAGHRIDAPDGPPRFPVAAIPHVQLSIARMLDHHAPAGVVSAAAAGADLLLLEQAVGRGLPVEVVLPLPEPLFLARSVADRGTSWVQRYDLVRRRAQVHEHDLSASADPYRTGNAALLEHALHLSDGHLLGLAVCREDDRDSVTADFRERAEASGVPVVLIDPSPPGATADDRAGADT